MNVPSELHADGSACDRSTEPYDELALVLEELKELNLPLLTVPAVRRETFPLSDGRVLSGLIWGEGAVEIVLLHGGAQNAHTWDAVALALNRPLLALDLPSHGHSGPAKDLVHDPASLAADVAEVIVQAAPSAKAVCSLSLGGLASITLAALRPDLVRRLVLVDVTPGLTEKRPPKQVGESPRASTTNSFEKLLGRARRLHPGRPEAALTRSVLHGAMQGANGSWIWRHERHPRRHPRRSAFAQLWEQLGTVRAPTMLVRGMRPSSLVDDDDEARLRRQLPEARVEQLHDAGHSAASEQPIALAALLESFIY